MVTSPLPGSIGGSMERPLFERSLTACVLLGVVWWPFIGGSKRNHRHEYRQI